MHVSSGCIWTPWYGWACRAASNQGPVWAGFSFLEPGVGCWRGWQQSRGPGVLQERSTAPYSRNWSPHWWGEAAGSDLGHSQAASAEDEGHTKDCHRPPLRHGDLSADHSMPEGPPVEGSSSQSLSWPGTKQSTLPKLPPSSVPHHTCYQPEQKPNAPSQASFPCCTAHTHTPCSRNYSHGLPRGPASSLHTTANGRPPQPGSWFCWRQPWVREANRTGRRRWERAAFYPLWRADVFRGTKWAGQLPVFSRVPSYHDIWQPAKGFHCWKTLGIFTCKYAVCYNMYLCACRSVSKASSSILCIL